MRTRTFFYFSAKEKSDGKNCEYISRLYIDFLERVFTGQQEKDVEIISKTKTTHLKNFFFSFISCNTESWLVLFKKSWNISKWLIQFWPLYLYNLSFCISRNVGYTHLKGSSEAWLWVKATWDRSSFALVYLPFFLHAIQFLNNTWIIITHG